MKYYSAKKKKKKEEEEGSELHIHARIMNYEKKKDKKYCMIPFI